MAVAVKDELFSAERPEKRRCVGKNDWITPQEQCNRFYQSIAERISIVSQLIPVIARLISEYILDESVLYWHKALSILKALPEKIPPLPENILEILNRTCPIFGGDNQIKGTHLLALVAEDFKTISHFNQHFLKPYLNSKEVHERFAFQFTDFGPDTPHPAFRQTHWVLLTVSKGLPESMGKTWDQQVELVNTLKRESGLDYRISSIQQMYIAMVTHKIATQKPSSTFKSRAGSINFRVQETTESGIHVHVCSCPHFPEIYINGVPLLDNSHVSVAPVLELT